MYLFRKKIAVGMLCLFFMLTTSFYPACAVEEKSCVKALVDCLGTASDAGAANPYAGALITAFCLNGFVFCINYIE